MTTKKNPSVDEEGIDLSDAPEADLSNATRGRSRFADKRVELPLAGLRAAVRKTQVDVAAVSGINQGDISKLEARSDLDDVSLSTLRRYIEALGGHLELVATMPNGARIVVREALESAELGRNLKAARVRAGLSTDQLSEVTGFTRQLIDRIEAGRVAPSAAYCKRVWAVCSAGTKPGTR